MKFTTKHLLIAVFNILVWSALFPKFCSNTEKIESEKEIEIERSQDQEDQQSTVIEDSIKTINLVDTTKYMLSIDEGKILFETNSSTLLSSSYFELARLAEIMNDVQSLKIEVHGHTDSVGNDIYNLKLSEKRAKKVVQELIKIYNINQDRLSFKGFGETMPKASNTTPTGRMRNRRVEIKYFWNIK